MKSHTLFAGYEMPESSGCRKSNAAQVNCSNNRGFLSRMHEMWEHDGLQPECTQKSPNYLDLSLIAILLLVPLLEVFLRFMMAFISVKAHAAVAVSLL